MSTINIDDIKAFVGMRLVGTPDGAKRAISVINAANRFAFLNTIGAWSGVSGESTLIGGRTEESELISPYLVNPILPETAENAETIGAMYELANKAETYALDPILERAVDLNPVLNGLSKHQIAPDAVDYINGYSILLPESVGRVSLTGETMYDLYSGEVIPANEDGLEVYSKHVAFYFMIIAFAMDYRDPLLESLDAVPEYSSADNEEKGVFSEILLDSQGFFDDLAAAIFSSFWGVLRLKRQFIAANGTNLEVWTAIVEAEAALEASILAKREELVAEGPSTIDELAADIFSSVPEGYNTLVALYDKIVLEPFLQLQMEANLGSERVESSLRGLSGSMRRTMSRAMARGRASVAPNTPVPTVGPNIKYIIDKISDSFPLMKVLKVAYKLTLWAGVIYAVYRAAIHITDKLTARLDSLCGKLCSENRDTICLECIKATKESDLGHGINKGIIYSASIVAGLIGLRYLVPKLVDTYKDYNADSIEAVPVDEEPLLLESPDAQT